MRGAAAHDRLVLAVAALSFCAHLAWLPRHLEDIDSINFALALRDYDVAAHQPHPPGYPVFVLLARGVAALVAPAVPDASTQAAIALSLLAALASLAALLALHAVLRLLIAPPTPLLATSLVASAPMFWITGARPLSDMPGLAGALACHLLILRAARDAARWRDAVVAAVACGLAVGIRSQVAWLVVPLLAWLLWRVLMREGFRRTLALGSCALAAVGVWAVPMVLVTGGTAAYKAALVSQAAEDFEGVPMLVMQPGVRRLAVALVETFVLPWGVWTLAAFVLALAAVGLVGLHRRGRLATWLVLGFSPYLLYHLLFQETETTRYALPIVVPVATSVVLATRVWTGRISMALVALACAVSLGVSVQAHRQYVGRGVTVSETLEAMAAAARAADVPPHVLMHRRVWAETRRARAALHPQPPYDVLPSPIAFEWKEAAALWQRDPDAEVWWLVDPRRGDDVAIDPRARTAMRHVGWPVPVDAVLGGMRPHPFDWATIRRPHWVLLDGWGLTPELGGRAAAAGQGPSTTGATALVRGQSGEVTLLVGGRHVVPAGATPATIAVRVGNGWHREVQVPPGDFALTWTLPAGSLPASGYVPLEVKAADAGHGPERLLLEQFDVQPVGVPVVALHAGWYEPERDTATGRRWRWVADESRLRIAGATGDVRISVGGTWPRHYDRDPEIEIRADGQVIGRHVLSRPFRFEQVVTAAQLQADGGQVTWRVTPSFVAGERTGTADARRLALEIAQIAVQPVR